VDPDEGTPFPLASLFPARPAANAGHWRGFYGSAQLTPRRAKHGRPPFWLSQNVPPGLLIRLLRFNPVTLISLPGSGVFWLEGL